MGKTFCHIKCVMKNSIRILQGLGDGPGSATERWPCRKNSLKSAFFRKKIKITPQKIFVLHISSSYAKKLGETNFRTREILRSGSKAKDAERKR